MKSLEQIFSYESDALDGRDLNRLLDFVPVEDWPKLGAELKEGIDPSEVKAIEFSRENVLKQLEKDVAFGFEKALNQRGMSAGMMHSVVSMWNWVLEEGLEDFDGYAQYGLPLFKATAVKYGFPNEIGEDAGDEYSYSADYGYE